MIEHFSNHCKISEDEEDAGTVSYTHLDVYKRQVQGGLDAAITEHAVLQAALCCGAGLEVIEIGHDHAVGFHLADKNPLTYDSMPAEFLCDLTKNLTTHLTHNLCAVLP